MRREFFFPTILILCLLISALTPSTFSANKEKFMPAVRQFLAYGEGERLKVWVYFKDHGEKNSGDLQKALSNVDLTGRALKRRLNRSRGPLVDTRDLPVNEAYLDRLRSLGLVLKRTSKYLNAVSTEATTEQLHRLSDLPFVKKIDRVRSYRRRPLEEPVKTIEPSLNKGSAKPGDGRCRRSSATDLYGDSRKQLDLINVIPLHVNNRHGESVLVAILDTGFNRSHEALDHLDIVAEWDFIYSDSITKNQPNDISTTQHDHGTYTLSALAGYAPGNLIGPAWGASFALAKTERKWEEVQGEEDDFVRALEWADSLGAEVVSSSLGYFDWYTYADLDGNSAVTTVAADIAAAKGITIVTAAGNEGPLPWPGIIAPSDGDSVIAVGAVDSFGVVISWSSRGPSYDGRIKPDVMAMGRSVVSASPIDSLAYVRTSGTSLSTPLVAGSVALLLQIHPYWTPMDVWTALTNEASNSASPNNNYGWGIIDACASSLGGPTGTLEGLVLNSKVWNDLVTISIVMPGAPETHLMLQRKDWEAKERTWTPYKNVDEDINVDSTTQYMFREKLPPGVYYYRVQLAADSSVISSPVDVRVPYGSRLGQSYPNPYVRRGYGQLMIPFSVGGEPNGPGESAGLWEYRDVALVIYDVTGARVRTLIDNDLRPPGEYRASWNGLNDRGILVSSGVYYYRLSVGDISLARKLVFLR